MEDNRTEACGRCSMTSVVSMTSEDESETGSRDPFGDARIELEESELRATSKPQIWLGRVKRRLDEVATRLTYGR